MSTKAKSSARKETTARIETMRIAGKHVSTDDVVEVRNPYDNSLVGTVPMARPEHVREAFAKAKAFKPKLSRYERQQILLKTADLLSLRREEFAKLISAESGLCWKDAIYEATRAYDVYSFAGQLCIKDDGEQFSCDISPNGKARKIFTTRVPLMGVISAITPFSGSKKVSFTSPQPPNLVISKSFAGVGKSSVVFVPSTTGR